MLRLMTHRLILLAMVSASVFQISSCSGDPSIPIAGNNQAAVAKGEKIYQQAKAADDVGKVSKAIRLYDRTATDYPFAPSAATARFRQAELLEKKGDILDSFDAYDLFLTQFQGSGRYSTALNRQIAMAQSAADGDVKQSMLGLKTRLSLEKTVEMLGTVRSNAPKTAAARAQFTVGQLYENKKKSKEAIAAYRQLVQDQPGASPSPDALFRIGQILTAEADRGNQNQANLDLAKEAFSDYLLQYPGDSRNAEARKMIANIDGRDLKRTFDIAEFYLKTGKNESAKVYYRDIVKRTKSGELHDKSVARLKELGE
jgi:outer membrane protein assembly factor BamD (BamD/ComL family)